ncbi:MAG TPA: amidohydrolase family protein [Luteimonas sp.]|nr:amidohydrolase family protein [Luteimonas sp.]
MPRKSSCRVGLNRGAVLSVLLATATPTLAGDAPTGAQSPPSVDAALAIDGVTVIDVESGRSVGPRTVVVDGGRIVAIARARDLRIPANARHLDGHGRFLIPGLVDMHVHLFNNASRRPPNDWAFPLFVANGVTGVREMNVAPASIPVVNQWRASISNGELIAPRILAAGVAAWGPSPADATRQVDEAADAGADFIKVFSEVAAPEWNAILEAAKRRGIPVAGHVPAGVSLLEAARAGQRSSEHLMQAFEACSSVEAEMIASRRGLDGDALVARRDAQETRALARFDRHRCQIVSRQLARTGQVQVPTLVLTRILKEPGPDTDPRWKLLRGDERTRWQRNLSALTSQDDVLERQRWRVARAIVSAMHHAGVPILAGTDSPMPKVYPGFSLHEELALLVQCGLTPLEALRSATLAPARYLGITTQAGSIAVGKRADLVLLDADPLKDIRNTRRINAVVIGGRLLRRNDIDALLAGAAR